MKKRVLLTGFEPFGGAASNPAQDIALALDGRESDRYSVHSAILPVERFGAISALQKQIERHKPEVVICLGVAVGRASISLEKVAINFDDFRIADNAGQQPIGEPIEPAGPNAYFSSLPLNRIVEALNDKDIAAEISFSAGTFVCNHLMYGTLRLAEKSRNRFRTGFIHIPQCSEQVIDAAKPCMAREEMQRAIEIAVDLAAHYQTDIKRNAGDTH
jgi:pyroglutamyl-peptidase